jgi:SAM-dependent methyltransferase
VFKTWTKLLEDLRARFIVIADQTEANAERLDRLAGQIETLRRENRVLISALSLPPAALWAHGPPHHPAEAPSAVFGCSTLCRQDSFDQPYFATWIDRLGLGRSYHRKNWEFVFICQALSERGAIQAGSRALGFGVGLEPLSAYFAAQGCEVVATDLPPERAAALGWTETQQHAAGLEALRRPRICDADAFDARVSFRVCDMNAVPDDLDGFDFCWSACALEHLGSIDAGLSFIERSLDCLRPGGWAIHTTEFNLSSNDATLTEGATVLYRRRDIEALVERLTAQGHQVAPLDLTEGQAPVERYIDVPPYREMPHLRLLLEGYVTTSVGLIIRKRPVD